jgi:hypothetical protein
VNGHPIPSNLTHPALPRCCDCGRILPTVAAMRDAANAGGCGAPDCGPQRTLHGVSPSGLERVVARHDAEAQLAAMTDRVLGRRLLWYGCFLLAMRQEAHRLDAKAADLADLERDLQQKECDLHAERLELEALRDAMDRDVERLGGEA